VSAPWRAAPFWVEACKEWPDDARVLTVPKSIRRKSEQNEYVAASGRMRSRYEGYVLAKGKTT